MNSYPGFFEFLKIMLSEASLAKGVRIKLLLILYRFSSYCLNSNKIYFTLLFPVYILYKFYTEFILGMEFPAQIIAGPGLRIYHGHSLVVHAATKIGARCTLRQCVTIGNKINKEGNLTGVPTIGDDVEIGAGAVIIGEINIGNRVKVGACTVVSKNVPDDYVVVGQSTRMFASN